MRGGGGIRRTVFIKEKKPLQEFLKIQGRFAHVTEEDIKKCHQKHKRHIKRISLSLWHLSEADFNLNVDRSEHEQVFGRWYKKGSGTIKESAAYLFGTLLPPTRVAAGV